MLDANKKYQQKLMMREIVADYKAEQRSQSIFNWAAMIAIGVGVGAIAFATLYATAATAAMVIGG